jgi:alkylhydroperoxidase family enzyme
MGERIMARVPYLDESDLSPDDRDLLKRPIALFKALVNSPGGARAFSGMGRYIRFDSKLDPRLRELAILQIGYMTRAPYEWSHHIKIGYGFGVTDDDIAGLIAEREGRASRLSDLDRTVLLAAREMTGPGLAMTDATFATLKAAMTQEQLVDLTLVIAFYNAVVRVLGTLRIDVEPDYQDYLDRYPLPEHAMG